MAGGRIGGQGAHEGSPLYFASWAGQRIVISRTPAAAAAARGASSHPSATRHASVSPTPADPSPSATTPPIVATTMLLDPATGAAQPVALAGAWLPAVDPTGHLVVYWSGTLTAQGPAVALAAGALYLADWSAITGIPPVATPTPDGGRPIHRPPAPRHPRRAPPRPPPAAPARPARRPR